MDPSSAVTTVLDRSLCQHQVLTTTISGTLEPHDLLKTVTGSISVRPTMATKSSAVELAAPFYSRCMETAHATCVCWTLHIRSLDELDHEFDDVTFVDEPGTC